MAAREAERRQPSGYAFLVGHALLVLGYIFFTVGFATDHWLTTYFGHHGLWEKCVGQLCDIITPGELSGWVEATRAMQTMALMCYMFAVLLALCLHCVKHTFDPPAAATPPTPLTRKARVLEIFTGIGCAFCLIGVSAFGGKGQDEGTLGYSYALSVFSLFLTTIGTIMVAVTRQAVTSNTLNRVTPQQQAAAGVSVPAVTNPHLPQGLSGTAFYPYGRGQPNPEQPSSDGGQNGNPYPYGHAATPLPPSNPSRPLPYPLYPEESGNTGNFGAAMTTPEPGRPIAGDGRGIGHSRGQGRLPPITEATPSAPPLPPPPQDGEQPPSYLEAIGQTHP